MGRFIRMIVALAVSVLAGAVTLVILSTHWAFDRLEEAAYAPDPVSPLEDVMSMLIYSVHVTPGLTLLPPLAAVILGEVLRVRSLLYYVAAGGVAAIVVPVTVGVASVEPAGFAGSMSAGLTIVATSGFAAGFFYWLLAGRYA